MIYLKSFNESIAEGTIEEVVADINDIFLDSKDEKYVIKVRPIRRKSRKSPSYDEIDLRFYNINIHIEKHELITTSTGYQYWTDVDFDIKGIMDELQRLNDYLKSIGVSWCKFNGELSGDYKPSVDDWELFEQKVNEKDEYIVSTFWIYCKIDVDS